MDEAVSEARVDIASDITNVHLELLRQFHIQQLEMANLLKEFTQTQATLTAEIKKLRKDYEELKHIVSFAEKPVTFHQS